MNYLACIRHRLPDEHWSRPNAWCQLECWTFSDLGLTVLGWESTHWKLDAVNVYFVILTLPRRRTTPGLPAWSHLPWRGRLFFQLHKGVAKLSCKAHSKDRSTCVIPGCPLGCGFRIVPTCLPFLPLYVQWGFKAAPFPWVGVDLEEPILGAGRQWSRRNPGWGERRQTWAGVGVHSAFLFKPHLCHPYPLHF